MRNLSLVPVVGVGIVAIALVAHVWMFDAVGDHVPADALATTPAFAQHVPHAAPGCAGGMSACEIPMPDDPRSAVPLSALVGCVWFLGVACMNLRAARAPSGSATDRAPPRPSTASSVVLRV